MNVIFLDIDGVLNYDRYDWEYIRYLREKTDDSEEMHGYDLKKIDIIAEICHKLNASVVLSSSWKLGMDMITIPKSIYDLSKEFYERGVDFLGVTPSIPNPERSHGQEMWKEWDIQVYLHEHPEIEKFCIIDDESYDLETMRDYLLQTKYKINEAGDGGILIDHIDEINNIFEKSKNYKR